MLGMFIFYCILANCIQLPTGPKISQNLHPAKTSLAPYDKILECEGGTFAADFNTFMQHQRFPCFQWLPASVCFSIFKENQSEQCSSLESELRIHPRFLVPIPSTRGGLGNFPVWKESTPTNRTGVHLGDMKVAAWVIESPNRSLDQQQKWFRARQNSFSKPPSSSKLVEPVNTLGSTVWPFDGSVLTLNVFCPSAFLQGKENQSLKGIPWDRLIFMM